MRHFKRRIPIWREKKPHLNMLDCLILSRPDIPAPRTTSRGPKGLQLEIGPRRSPWTSSLIYIQSNVFWLVSHIHSISLSIWISWTMEIEWIVLISPRNALNATTSFQQQKIIKKKQTSKKGRKNATLKKQQQQNYFKKMPDPKSARRTGLSGWR